MKKIVLSGTDRAEFELGITQNPSEVTNANGFRILTKPTEDGKFACIGLERVGTTGTWELFNSESFVNLANAVLNDNIDSVDIELLKKQNIFYLEILKNVEGNPFMGLEDPAEEMDKIISVNNPRIEEKAFLRDYAIFFLQHYPTMCEKDPDYPAKYAAAMKRWGVEVAKLNSPVDVVDRNTAGTTVLFTIPAMISSADIFNNSKGMTINEMTHETAFLAQTNPAGAEEYLERKLIEKIEIISEKERKEVDLANVRALDDIRERYNLPRWLPIVEDGATPPAEEVAESKPTTTTAGFDYDEMGEF